jgi:hypothetical protein
MRALIPMLVAACLAAGCLPSGTPAPPAAASDDSTDVYRIEMITMSDDMWHAIRYNVETGAAWEVIDGKWSSIKDSATLPESRYRVHMVPLRADWGAVRLDVHSGRSWRAERGTWVEITLAK